MGDIFGNLFGFGSQPPPAPDFTGAAEAQAGASQQATNQQMYANRPNQYTPFGATTWTPEQVQDPSTGQWYTTFNQNTQLAQPLANAANSQMNIAQNLSGLGEQLVGSMGGSMITPPDWQNAPAAGGSISAGPLANSLDFGGAPGMPDSSQVLNQRGIDAAMNQYQSRLDPQWDQRAESYQSQLLNQGLRPGDEAYNQAMSQFGQQRNDAYQSALNNSVLQGAQIGGQMFGQDMASRQQGVNEIGQQGAFQNQAAGQNLNMQQQASSYQNQLRQQALAEQMQQQGWGINTVNSLLSGQQVGMPQMPGFQGAGMAQTPQYLNAASQQYGAGLDAFNAQQAQQQGLMQGAASLPFMF